MLIIYNLRDISNVLGHISGKWASSPFDQMTGHFDGGRSMIPFPLRPNDSPVVSSTACKPSQLGWIDMIGRMSGSFYFLKNLLYKCNKGLCGVSCVSKALTKVALPSPVFSFLANTSFLQCFLWVSFQCSAWQYFKTLHFEHYFSEAGSACFQLYAAQLAHSSVLAGWEMLAAILVMKPLFLKRL